jgi:hypothetical protein|tara:strand:+ start:622 stop:798 length:177 start_codon:yes stop_codon:yes gene_type:complete
MVIPKDAYKTLDQYIKILQERGEVSSMITLLEDLKEENSEDFALDTNKVELLEKLKAL